MDAVLGWVGVSLGIVAAVAVAAYYRPRTPRGPSVWEIKADLRHRAPTVSFSLHEAHTAAKEHRACASEDCARKRAALRCLIAAGKLAPTPRLNDLLFVRFGDETH